MGMFDPVQRSAGIQQAFDQLNSQLNFSKPAPINMESPQALEQEIQKAMQEGNQQKANFYQKRLQALKAQRESLGVTSMAGQERNKMLGKAAERNMPMSEEDKLNLEKKQLDVEKGRLDIAAKKLDAVYKTIDGVPIPKDEKKQAAMVEKLKTSNPVAAGALQDRILKYNETVLDIEKKAKDLKGDEPKRILTKEEFEALNLKGGRYDLYRAAAMSGVEGNELSRQTKASAEAGSKKGKDTLKLAGETVRREAFQKMAEEEIAKIEDTREYLSFDSKQKAAIKKYPKIVDAAQELYAQGNMSLSAAWEEAKRIVVTENRSPNKQDLMTGSLKEMTPNELMEMIRELESTEG